MPHVASNLNIAGPQNLDIFEESIAFYTLLRSRRRVPSREHAIRFKIPISRSAIKLYAPLFNRIVSI